MKKRTFLKLSSAIVTGAAIAPFAGCTMDKQQEPLKNWAGNLRYSTANLVEPKTIEEAQQIIKSSRKLRALGTRHCFNTIADSDSTLISSRLFNQLSPIDKLANTITVGGGIRYGELCRHLDAHGFSIPNLASLPHISVAGACATATHGSGVANGNLATPVVAIELITGKGDVITLSREKDPETFYGAVVGLGTLGLVTKVTLELMPSFSVRQDVYLNLPMQQLENHFDEIMSAGYSVSLFHDWQTSSLNQVWIKRVVKDGESTVADSEFFDATPATRDVHPIMSISAENCTPQMGVAGPWYERLPHFKMNFTPSSGEELQAEYFVPIHHAVNAIKAVATLREQIGPLLMITEIRSIASDEFWMSPCYHQPSIAIHFTLQQNVEGVTRLLPQIEEKLEPFHVKPHWGKLFSIPFATLKSRYEKLTDFQQLATELDPDGKFRNEFVNKNVFGVAER